MDTTSRLQIMHKRLTSLAAACSPTMGLETVKSVAAVLGDDMDLQSMSDLYDVLQEAIKADSPQQDSVCLIGTALALNHLPSKGPKVLQQYMDNVLIPLLCTSKLPSHTMHMQVGGWLCQQLVIMQWWIQLQILVQNCSSSLKGLATNTAQPSTGSNSLPLHAVCCLVPAIVKACSPQSEDIETVPQTAAAAAAVLRVAVTDLTASVLALLRSETASTRQAVLRALVPSLMAAAATLGPAEATSFLNQAVQTCSSMLNEGGTARRTALAALVVLAPTLSQHDGHSGQLTQQLIPCLAGADKLDRKRAAYLLQLLQSHSSSNSQQAAWQAWFSLHSLMEEFGMHLIKPAWVQMNKLHPAAPQYQDAALDTTHVSAPRKKLRGRKAAQQAEENTSSSSTLQAQADDGGGDASQPLDMAWLCVLWQRGLQHVNVQVQRMVLRSFCQRAWSDGDMSAPGSRRYAEVPLGFITDVLIPSFTVDNIFGTPDMSGGYDTKEAACQWLATWLSTASTADQRAVCQSFMSVINTKGISGRAIHTATTIWAGCISAADKLDHSSDNGAWALKMLSSLESLCAATDHHKGSSLKKDVQTCVLLAAPVLAPVQYVGPAAALHLIAKLPAQEICPGGAFNQLGKRYLFMQGGNSGMQHISSSLLFKSVQDLPGLAIPADQQAKLCQRMLSTLATSWQELEATGQKLTSSDVKLATSLVQPMVTLAMVTADLPSTPIAALLQQTSSDLESLYNRTYVPGLSMAKRLLLVKELIQATLPQLAGLPSDCGLLSTLNSVTATLSATSLPAYCAIHMDAFVTQPMTLNTQSAIQTTMSASGTTSTNRASGNDRETASSKNKLDALFSQEPQLREQLLLAQISMETLSLLMMYQARATQLRSTGQQTNQQSMEHLAQPLVTLLSHFVNKHLPTINSSHHIASDMLYAIQDIQLHAVQQACDAIAACCNAASQLATTASQVLSNATSLIAAVQKQGCSQVGSHTRKSHFLWPCLDSVLNACTTVHAAKQRGANARSSVIMFHDNDNTVMDRHGTKSQATNEQRTSGSSNIRQRQLTASIHMPPSIDVKPRVTLLQQALDELGTAESNELLPVLRVARRCWAALLETAEDNNVQATVAQAFDLDLTTLSDKASSLKTGITWAVLRAVTSAMSGTNKRSVVLCSAFVNTILLPQLFGDRGSRQALHGPEGPVPWALKRLIDWGSSSHRVMVLVCCQLASFIQRYPFIISQYKEQLARLLLHGVTQVDLAPDTNMSSGLPGEEAAVPDLDAAGKALLAGLAGVDVAPRAALLCALHQVALQAGLVWKPTPSRREQNKILSTTLPQAAVKHTSSEGHPAVMHASNVQHNDQMHGGDAHKAPTAATTSQEPEQQKRPVIIFHDAGDWDDRPINSTASTTTTTIINTAEQQQVKQEGDGAGAATQPNMPASTNVAAQSSQNTASSSQSKVDQGLANLGRLSGAVNDCNGLNQDSQAPTSTTANTHLARALSLNGIIDSAVATQIKPSTPGPASQEAIQAALALWEYMLHLAIEDPTMSTDKIKFGSDIHRRKVRLWQALCVMSSFLPDEDIPAVVNRLLAIFTLNDPPTVKQYQEALVASLILKQPQLAESMLLPLLTSYEKHHPGLGSFILIAAQVALHAEPAWQARLLAPLLLAISPWLTCHTHNVRSFAQLVMYAMLEKFGPDHPAWQHQQGDLSYLRHFQKFCDTNHDLVRLRRGIGAPILEWSPEGLTAPWRLLAKGVSLAGQPDSHSLFECAPVSLMDHITQFLMRERFRLREELSDRMADIEYVQAGLLESTASTSQANQLGSGPEGAMDYQRKVMSMDQEEAVQLKDPGSTSTAASDIHGLWHNLVSSGIIDLIQLAQEQESGAAQPLNDLRLAAKGNGSRQEIIIVATLVDKLPNLAGLARTCEVFRAAQLVVPDLRVAADPMFSSISVTAELWVPMIEVKESALLPWLEHKQAEGYTLVGLEQTADSVKLTEYAWPSRCVLVLGREKEGMPPEVMMLLDNTVEIPQLGLIRSLNVHVSGAIAMYEYTKQQLATK